MGFHFQKAQFKNLEKSDRTGTDNDGIGFNRIVHLYFFSQFITLDLKKLILIIFSLNERALSPKKVTFDNGSAGERPSVPDVGCQND